MNTTQKSDRHFGVAFKLVVFIILTGFIFVGIQTGLNFKNARDQSKAKAEQELLEDFRDYKNEIERIEKASSALSISFAGRPDLLELFLAGNREGVLNLLTPVFKTMAADYDIVHLYVHNPDGTVFVRIHNPLKFGDDITYRRTAAIALRSQKVVSGVDIGPSRLGIRSVSPLFYRGELVGMVEVGLDYDQPFIDQFKTTHGSDFTMWLTTEAAAPARLNPAPNALASPMPDRMFYYAGTRSTTLPVPTEIYNRVLRDGEPEIQFVSDNNEELTVLVAPLTAYGDRIIGILEISRSRTEELAALQRSQISLLVIASGLSLLSLATIWGAINFVVLRPLRHLTSVAGRQLEGDLAARVQLSPGDEFGQLGCTLNTLTEQLDHTLSDQEVVIARRTSQLQLTLEIVRRLSSILDAEQLLAEVVNLIRDSFNLYHVQIYLLDQEGEHLELAEGYGEVGAEMKAAGHTITLIDSQSLAARAVRTNKIMRVDNVQTAEGWQPNPLLPEIRSEMAVPIEFDERVIGVLEMYSNREAGIGKQDEAIVSTIVSKVSVAIHNAQRFTETTHALTEAQKIQRLYTQSGWHAYKLRQKTTSYQQTRPDAAPVEDKLLAQVKQNVNQGRLVIMTPSQQNGEGNQTQSAVAVPLSIRGQVVGHIRIHDTEQGRGWSAEEIALLESVGEQMSLAIENARLFDDTQQRASREQLTREITDKMRTSPDVDSIIETGLTELANALGVSRTYVKLTSKLEEGK